MTRLIHERQFFDAVLLQKFFGLLQRGAHRRG